MTDRPTQAADWVLVPREPTPQQMDAYWHAMHDPQSSLNASGYSRSAKSQNWRRKAKLRYAAMLAAAPTPPTLTPVALESSPAFRALTSKLRIHDGQPVTLNHQEAKELAAFMRSWANGEVAAIKLKQISDYIDIVMQGDVPTKVARHIAAIIIDKPAPKECP